LADITRRPAISYGDLRCHTAACNVTGMRYVSNTYPINSGAHALQRLHRFIGTVQSSFSGLIGSVALFHQGCSAQIGNSEPWFTFQSASMSIELTQFLPLNSNNICGLCLRSHALRSFFTVFCGLGSEQNLFSLITNFRAILTSPCLICIKANCCHLGQAQQIINQLQHSPINYNCTFWPNLHVCIYVFLGQVFHSTLHCFCYVRTALVTHVQCEITSYCIHSISCWYILQALIFQFILGANHSILY